MSLEIGTYQDSTPGLGKPEKFLPVPSWTGCALDVRLRTTYAVAIATAKIVRDFPTHVVRLLGRCIAALTGKSYSQFPEKPDVYLLQDGMYSGKSCVPPIEVKADGQDQKVSGYPYFDTMGVKIWTIAQLS